MGDPIVTENRRDSTQDTSIVYKNMDCDSRGPKLSPAAVKKISHYVQWCYGKQFSSLGTLVLFTIDFQTNPF